MKNILDKIKKFGILETIVFVLYIVIIMIIGITHECFEDETQSWLIARDLNFIEIIQQMKYEGHAFLWYFILAPFAKLGFPIETQIYITSLFSIGTVYLILKKSPFNKFVKVLLTFSGGMVYFYSVMARPYCMIPFLLACISVLYKNRRKYSYLYCILIGLLANTHLIMLPTSGLLFITFFIEELILKRKDNTKEDKIKLYKSILIAILLISVYLIIVIFTLYNCEVVDNFNRMESITDPNTLFNIIKNTCIKTIDYLYGASNSPVWYQGIIAFIITLCIIGTLFNIKQGVIFWSQLIFTILVHGLAWFILAPRVFIVIYTLMFWVWNYKEDEQYKKKQRRNIFIEAALILLIIITIPSSYKLCYDDITGYISTGKLTARYIKNNIPEGACFICSEQELQQSVIGYLKKDKYKFYMPNTDDFFTFITWDEKWNTPIFEKDVYNSVEKLKDQYKDLYILSVMPETDTMSENYEFLFSTEDKRLNCFYARTEIFSIYKVNT